MEKGAIISDCRKYRYSLWRIWDDTKPMVMFLMLNPSTADAEKDDPTIRRCIGFAKDWGYGGLYVCNLFAYRATNPKALLKTTDPFGIYNSHRVKVTSLICDKIVCAWGNAPIVTKLKGQYLIAELILAGCNSKLYYLELSKDKIPKHPLYLKKDLLPQPFNK